MRIFGADFSGAESRASIYDEDGSATLVRSCAPRRPSSILLPLVRSEKALAGDRALTSERGSGFFWPPLAQASPPANPEPPVENSQGRILIASAWHRLSTATTWQDSKWSPPDGLPKLTKPSPAECIEIERRALFEGHVASNESNSCVLAVPNQLPEESQQALLNVLPSGSRLVWRAVAAAMQHLDGVRDRGQQPENLTVVDVGPSSIERSKFTIRRISVGKKIFLAPVRKATDLAYWPAHTGFFETAFSPSGFKFNHGRLRSIAAEVLGEADYYQHIILCGPGAEAFATVVADLANSRNIRTLDHLAVAQGAALFGQRVAHKLPTYFDQLPSLELFTLTETREPRWLILIQRDHEIQGGEVFQATLPRTAFIREGTARVSFWLQRSGETDFRKLTTDLPSTAGSNTWTDFTVNAGSAGGFATVRMKPSTGECDIFGENRSVHLNWLSMERVRHTPGEKWPIKIEHGWPACGKLYSFKPLFNDFLESAEGLKADLASDNWRIIAHRLAKMKEAVRKTVAPRLVGITSAADDGAPIAQLLTFGTECPGVFVAPIIPSGKMKMLPCEPRQHDRAQEIADTLWRHLRRSKDRRREEIPLIYVLGRMGGYATDDFADRIARTLGPSSKTDILFPAGRVLRTPGHGNLLFRAISLLRLDQKRLNNAWLRAIVYATYQNEEILSCVPRDHLFHAFEMCVAELQRLVAAENARIGFVNCLRTLALLLRARRYAACRDFLCLDSCPSQEVKLLTVTKKILREADDLQLSEQKQSLLQRLRDWINFSSDTDEMPPITTDDDNPGEEDEE